MRHNSGATPVIFPRAEQPFEGDVIAGLSATPKRLPSRYFYDEVGSKLFEAITALPEYYPTRSEIGLLEANVDAIARLVPSGACLVEFGSGSSTKTRILLRALTSLLAYVPIDVSGEFVLDEAARLRAEFPSLDVLPVVADFSQPFSLPSAVRGQPFVGFFPGSTIGNLEPEDARAFLADVAGMTDAMRLFIVGVDLVKDPAVLHEAYNDAGGITAAFNLNLLAHINRELAADFDLSGFEHQAFYDPVRQRVEMHLVSRGEQTVHIGSRFFHFAFGETIHTENSYKYGVEQFRSLAREAGWLPAAVWTDASKYFAVHVLAAHRT